MFEQTILIVDDEKSNRRILKNLLQEQAKIIFAKNGHQAIELTNKHLPDLILMDVLMPEFSGFDVIDVLKKNNRTMHIAVIFITGLTYSDDEAQGFSLGCCDYIYKPFKSNVVIARVMMHLELIRQRKILNDIAHVDALTGVSNRRKMDEVLADEILANNRNKTTLVIAMLDIDFFKPYNDNYGHGAGDIALRQVGDILRDSCKRPRDFVARYGGEEFVVVLPDSTLEGAKLVLEGISESIREKEITHQYSDVASVLTISIGAIVIEDCPNCTVDNVLKKADQLLYQAKGNGRNQLVIKIN